MTIPRPSRHCDQGTSIPPYFGISLCWYRLPLCIFLTNDLINLCASAFVFCDGWCSALSPVVLLFRFRLVWFLYFCFLIAWGASSLACTDTLPFFLIRVRVAGVGLLSYHFSFLSCSFSRSEYHLFCAHEFCLRFLGPLFLHCGPDHNRWSSSVAIF